VLDRENWLKQGLKLSAVDVANIVLTMVTAYDNIELLLKYRATPGLWDGHSSPYSYASTSAS